MKILGWVYVIAFSFDALVSVVYSFTMKFESLSNHLSMVVLLMTVAAFILTCMNKLKPRKLYFTLCGFYFSMVVIGLVVGVLLVVKSGPEAMPTEGVLFYMGSQFAWYWPVHWILTNLWCLMAVAGLAVLYRSRDSREAIPFSEV